MDEDGALELIPSSNAKQYVLAGDIAVTRAEVQWKCLTATEVVLSLRERKQKTSLGS